MRVEVPADPNWDSQTDPLVPDPPLLPDDPVAAANGRQPKDPPETGG